MNVQGVRTIRKNLGKAFLLHMQTKIGAIESYAQGMRAGGKWAVEMKGFANMLGLQPRRKQQFLARVDSNRFIGDSRNDFNAQ